MSVHPDFKSLFIKEQELLSEADKSRPPTKKEIDAESPGPAGEPWVRYTPVERVGLAFSGGGIRSATFNLGVLKALHELGLLKHIDYLSTVSGGGYVGAWWSAWRARWGTEFPTTLTTSQRNSDVGQRDMNREPAEVRHLREFSNFLSPRIGFFQSEMWNAIIAVLSAVLPAMLVASAVMALAFLIWLGVTSVILAGALNMPFPFPAWLKGALPPTALALFLIGLHICFELHWNKLGKAESLASIGQQRLIHGSLLIVISLLVFGGWYLLHASGLLNARPKDPPDLWMWATSISPPQTPLFSFNPAFSRYLFAGPILWFAIAIVLFVPRLLIMRRLRENAATLVSILDRALSRLLGSALIVSAIAALWLAGCWIIYTGGGAKLPAGGALVSGGAFALLRNWIGRLGPSKKGGVLDVIKPLIPQILAYVAIALWAVCVAALIAWLIKGDYVTTGGFLTWLRSPWILFGLAAAIVLFAVFAFDPAQVSMHSFYRNRLSRAYLGATNIDAVSEHRISAETNRQTDMRWRDDIELCALSPSIKELANDRKKPKEDQVYAPGERNSYSPSRVRPLHLVCCAANDLGGDHLENLSRGSRSAVLSKFGYAIGDHWKAWKQEKLVFGESHKTLGVASAITASAAAFNSNMGSLSMTLGAGVTFLCTALNLRLGLWLPHPLSQNHGSGVAAGWLFLKEMFGLTNSGLRPPPNHFTPVAQDVHLSDGGHFENLALYELVRRHCRYIIVSDCGADAEVSFDDFGNAVRRIREDFGVEIEIDLAPLKPNEARLSKQHVAVGTVSYDPRGDRKDNAILIYFKPALTGDEPCDIAQYRTRNEAFPHESTGDQFYDEAQWESYRRLGEHAALSAFRFVERTRDKDDLSAEAIFNGARWEWYQSPERREEKILELSGRLTALEGQLRQDAPAGFIREMYPELVTVGPKIAAGSGTTKPMISATPEDAGKTLHFLIQMIQLMEDVWFAAYLETHWNDPNNLGWMNTFQRWAYTPSFRLWWPILKPMFGHKFRRFMEERLSLADEDYPPTTATVTNREKKVPDGVAQTYWARMHTQDPNKEAGRTVYSFDLQLTLQGQPGGDITCPVQAGLAFVDFSDKAIAKWTVEEFFVPPSLWGAGIGAKFLDGLIKLLKDEKVRRCEVEIVSPEEDRKMAVEWTKRTDIATRQQLNDLLAFYQSANFKLNRKNLLVLDLG